jgi:integrase
MKRSKIRPAVKPPVPPRPKPVRSGALETFPAGAHTVRLLGPTKSCPYYSATFYLPGDRRPQRTTLGTDRAVASEWCREKAAELAGDTTGTQEAEHPRPQSTQTTSVVASRSTRTRRANAPGVTNPQGQAASPPRQRSQALETYAVGDRDVRLLGPTKSCPYYSATFYLPGDRRPQRTTLGTDRAVASEWCREKADELGRGLWLAHPDRPYQSVRRFVASFVNPDENVRNWKPRTREKYVELSRLLPEQFLDMECRFLTEEVLQNLVRDYAVGRKHSTTVTYKSFLTNLISYGRRRDWLLPQQLTRCELIVPRAHDEEDLDGAVDRDLLPTQEVLDRLVDAFANESYRFLIRLVLYTGLRFSEVAALTCTDVNLRTGKIRVNKAAVESNTGKIRLSTTKNRERRTVVFARESLPEMTAIVDAARRNLDAGGRGLLFTAARGGYLSRHNFGERQWRRAVRSTPGLPEGFHFHNLRHCAAVSMLDDRGLSISTVSAILGHRDVGVTERVYLKGRHGYSDQVASSMGW